MDEKKNEIILFENQGVKLEVNLREETVGLTQAQMEELFDVKHVTISKHISNIFKEGKLDENLLSEFPTKVLEKRHLNNII